MVVMTFFQGTMPVSGDPADDDLSWRELWAVEMRDRRWLWAGNVVLVCWSAAQFASTLL